MGINRGGQGTSSPEFVVGDAIIKQIVWVSRFKNTAKNSPNHAVSNGNFLSGRGHSRIPRLLTRCTRLYPPPTKPSGSVSPSSSELQADLNLCQLVCVDLIVNVSELTARV